jgi:hypothetical protein
MNKVILVGILLILATTGAIAASEPGFVSIQNIARLVIGTKTAKIAGGLSGPVAFQPSATCAVYLNASTATRRNTAIGYPLAASTEYKYNLPKTSDLTFTCTSTAAQKYIYLVR